MDTGRDTGSVTAEFALVAPAIVLLLAGGVEALAVSSQAIRLADAAGIAARATGRGDDELAHRIVAELAPGASMSVSRGDLVCVSVDITASAGPFPGGVPLSARSCAAADGE